MPEWMTPLFRPVWWLAMRDSFSRIASRAPGLRRKNSELASPRMPAPTPTRSYGPRSASTYRLSVHRQDSGWVLDEDLLDGTLVDASLQKRRQKPFVEKRVSPGTDRFSVQE